MFRRDTVTIDRKVYEDLMDERRQLMRLLLLGGGSEAVHQDAALRASERQAVVASNFQPPHEEPVIDNGDGSILGTGYDYTRGGMGGDDDA